MQDILYPPEESFEAKFKKTYKKQNQENKGVNHKFKSLFGRNNEAESAEQEQHKVYKFNFLFFLLIFINFINFCIEKELEVQ